MTYLQVECSYIRDEEEHEIQRRSSVFSQWSPEQEEKEEEEEEIQPGSSACSQ